MLLSRKRITIVAFSVAAFSAVYVGSYLVLSWFGQYQFSQTGRRRYSFGLAVSDVVIWQPVGAWWEPFMNFDGEETSRGNELGYFYSPLIRLDRLWFHPTRNLRE